MQGAEDIIILEEAWIPHETLNFPKDTYNPPLNLVLPSSSNRDVMPTIAFERILTGASKLYYALSPKWARAYLCVTYCFQMSASFSFSSLYRGMDWEM